MQKIARIVGGLTAVALTCVLAATAAAGQAGSDPYTSPVDGYQLTLPMLQKLVRAQSNIYAALKAHPELANALAARLAEDASTLDEMVMQVEAFPEIKAAVIKSGFTTREYTVAMLLMSQAAMIAEASGMPGVNTANLPASALADAAFLKAHPAEFARIKALGIEVEKLMPEDGSSMSGEQVPDTIRSPR